MAAPVANFSIAFTFGSLSVVLTDTSSDTPTTWDWDFGDGSTAATQGPHTVNYSTAGQYTITLVVTNADGSSSLQRQITVSTGATLPFSLKQIAKNKLRGISYDEEALDSYIAQWQLYIQPSVSPAVSSGDIFNENAYPPLANVLVAYLAAYSVQKDVMMQSLVGSSSSSTTGDSSGTSTTTSAGALKSIETGPSKAEWHDNTDKVTSFFKAGGSSSGTGASTGPLDVLQQEICIFAQEVGVNLPFCKYIAQGPILFVKATRTNKDTCRTDQQNDALTLFL